MSIFNKLKELKETIEEEFSKKLEGNKCTVTTEQVKKLSNLLEERVKLLDKIWYLENKEKVEEFYVYQHEQRQEKEEQEKEQEKQQRLSQEWEDNKKALSLFYI